MYIITGLYGGCTDIVNAVIDSSDTELYSEGMYINFSEEREYLNGAVDPTSSEDLYATVKNLELTFKTIQTTLEKRHIEPKEKRKIAEFKYIFVDPTSEKASAWINSRMQVLIQEFLVPDENQTRSRSVISRYSADLVITVDDILEGRLIEKLTPFVDTPLDTRLYEAWLSLIKYDFPFN